MSMQAQRIRIVLADDHPLMRLALRNVLEKQIDFEIVAEVTDGDEAVKTAEQLVPDVVILDISMPKLNGLDATRQIRAKCPTVAILVLTVHSDSEHVLGILEAGAAGYLTKSVFGDEVVQAVRAVVSGETVISPTVFQQVLKSALRHPRRPLPLNAGERLSVRELEILALMATGLSNKEIAEKLGLRLRTIKGCLIVLFSKLQVNSRTEAVTTALRLGLIELDGSE